MLVHAGEPDERGDEEYATADTDYTGKSADDKAEKKEKPDHEGSPFAVWDAVVSMIVVKVEDKKRGRLKAFPICWY